MAALGGPAHIPLHARTEVVLDADGGPVGLKAGEPDAPLERRRDRPAVGASEQHHGSSQPQSAPYGLAGRPPSGPTAGGPSRAASCESAEPCTRASTSSTG